jgi:mRNA interferase MazF
MCNLSESEGSIQSGYRPVFIVSNDKNNTYSPTINIIPITTKMNKRKLPVHVELWNYQRYGLKAPSTLMVEQTTTVALSSLDKYIGKILDKNVLGDISRAMRVQFPVIAV